MPEGYVLGQQHPIGERHVEGWAETTECSYACRGKLQRTLLARDPCGESPSCHMFSVSPKTTAVCSVI
ncbi:unnamed protein product [Caretta caretta]